MESELQDVAAEAARELAQHGLDGPAPRHVAALAKSMQAFQRALYGAAAVAQVARVPARLFRDLSPRGSLFAIVVTVALLRRDRAWDDRAAFGVPGNEAADMQDLWSVVHNLQQAGYWSPPRILLADGVPASERPSLEMIVKRLQGAASLVLACRSGAVLFDDS
nr:hypothetical protein HK105_002845 [Polyrhizophydium stewartii]